MISSAIFLPASTLRTPRITSAPWAARWVTAVEVGSVGLGAAAGGGALQRAAQLKKRRQHTTWGPHTHHGGLRAAGKSGPLELIGLICALLGPVWQERPRPIHSPARNSAVTCPIPLVAPVTCRQVFVSRTE